MGFDILDHRQRHRRAAAIEMGESRGWVLFDDRAYGQWLMDTPADSVIASIRGVDEDFQIIMLSDGLVIATFTPDGPEVLTWVLNPISVKLSEALRLIAGRVEHDEIAG